MKFLGKFFAVLAGAAVLGAVVAPWVHPWTSYPFDKVLNRCVLAWLIVFLVVFRKSLFTMPLARLGMSRAPGWGKELAYGAVFALISFAALAFLYYLLGARWVRLDLFTAKFFGRLGDALFAAVFVGVFEEIFFRGFILQGLLQTQKRWAAMALSSLFYALTHFLKPENFDAPHPVSVWFSLQALLRFLEPLQYPERILPYFLGLFLVGMVFSHAYIKTGRLYFSIGLHGGWVLLMKMDTHVIRPTELGGQHWFFGDGKLVNGLLGWEYMIAVFLWIRWFVPWKDRPRLRELRWK